MKSAKNFIHYVVLVVFFSICITLGHYQSSFAAQQRAWKPQGPMTIILNTYGGAYDWIARQLGKVLPEYLGQKVIIQAIQGAGGGNALDTVRKSKPDGRTMSLNGVGTYVALSMEKRYPWDVKDLPVIVAIDAPPYGLYTSTKSPYVKYEDLAKLKKEVRIAAGSANFSILPLILDFDKKGVQYKAARFKGSQEASLAVIAGNADLVMGGLTGVNTDHIRAGDFRTLLVDDTKRYGPFPDAPCITDLDMPKEWAKYRIVRLIQVAPETPQHIIKGLSEGITKALQDKRTIEWSKKVDTPVDIIPLEEMHDRIRVVLEGFRQNPKVMATYF